MLEEEIKAKVTIDQCTGDKKEINFMRTVKPVLYLFLFFLIFTPVFATTLFSETFTSSVFNLTGDGSHNCSNSIVTRNESIPLDNSWYCWTNLTNKDSRYYSYDGTQIKSQYGLKSSVEIYPEQGFNIFYMKNNESVFNITTDEAISFYCSAVNFSSGYPNYEQLWLVIEDYNQTNYPLTISLIDGGCDINIDPISPIGDCCEMRDLIGYDCSGNGKKTFSKGLTGIKAVCPYDSSTFENISRISLVQKTKSNSNSVYYFDDLLISDISYPAFYGITDPMDALNFSEYLNLPASSNIPVSSYFNYSFINLFKDITYINNGENLIIIHNDTDPYQYYSTRFYLIFKPLSNGFPNNIIESSIGFNMTRLNITSESINWMDMDLTFYDKVLRNNVSVRVTLVGTKSSTCDLYFDYFHLYFETGNYSFLINTSEVINECLPTYSKERIFLREVSLMIHYIGGVPLSYIKDEFKEFSYQMYETGSLLNDLPVFNYTITSDSCYNNSLTFQDVPINLSINAVDPENDTIYYAVSAQLNNIVNTFDFQENDILVQQCKPYQITDFNTGLGILDLLLFVGSTFFLKCEQVPLSESPLYVIPPEFIIYDDSCGILSNGNYSEFYISTMLNYESVQKRMLIMNSFCPKRKELFLDLKNSLGYLNDIYYSEVMYMSNTVNYTTNVTFYNDLLLNDINIKLKFIVNDTNKILVYNINETNTTLITVMTLPLYQNLLSIRWGLSFNYTNSKYTFSYVSSTGSQYDYISSSYSIYPKITKFISHSVSTNFLFIEKFSYGGNVLSPDFSTEIPKNMTVYRGNGIIDIKVYVTDLPHLGTDFTYFEAYLNLNQCREYGSNYITDDINSQIGSDVLDLIGVSKWILGDIARDSLKEMGLYEKTKYLIWLFFIFFLVSGIITEYLYSRNSGNPHITLTPSLIGSSFICLIVSFLLSMTVNFICFSILASFGIASVLRTHTIGGRN